MFAGETSWFLKKHLYDTGMYIYMYSVFIGALRYFSECLDVHNYMLHEIKCKLYISLSYI